MLKHRKCGVTTPSGDELSCFRSVVEAPQMRGDTSCSNIGSRTTTRRCDRTARWATSRRACLQGNLHDGLSRVVVLIWGEGHKNSGTAKTKNREMSGRVHLWRWDSLISAEWLSPVLFWKSPAPAMISPSGQWTRLGRQPPFWQLGIGWI